MLKFFAAFLSCVSFLLFYFIIITVYVLFCFYRLGYDIVRGLGHTMKDPLPSLFSFKIKVFTLHI